MSTPEVIVVTRIGDQTKYVVRGVVACDYLTEAVMMVLPFNRNITVMNERSEIVL